VHGVVAPELVGGEPGEVAHTHAMHTCPFVEETLQSLQCGSRQSAASSEEMVVEKSQVSPEPWVVTSASWSAASLGPTRNAGT